MITHSAYNPDSKPFGLFHHGYSSSILSGFFKSALRYASIPQASLKILPDYSLRYHRGDGEIRTHDPLLARQVLSQLSYTPISYTKIGINGLKWTRTTDLTLIRRAL